MSIKTLPYVMAITLLAPTISIADKEIRSNPAPTSHLSIQALSGQFIHDYFIRHPEEQRNLERILGIQPGSLSLHFDNTYGIQNQELEGWDRRDNTLVIYLTNKPRQSRIEQGQLVAPAYNLERFTIQNQLAFDELYKRILQESQHLGIYPQTTQQPQETNNTQGIHQQQPQPETSYTQPYQPQIKPKKKGPSDLELFILGLAAGATTYHVLKDDHHRGYYRHNYRNPIYPRYYPYGYRR